VVIEAFVRISRKFVGLDKAIIILSKSRKGSRIF
jgi:hypothetical protein